MIQLSLHNTTGIVSSLYSQRPLRTPIENTGLNGPAFVRVLCANRVSAGVLLSFVRGSFPLPGGAR